MYEKYIEAKPDVLVTHDGPQSVVTELFHLFREESIPRTRGWLDAMLTGHLPKICIFGHWHQSRDTIINGTRFIVLDELETKDIEL